MELYTQNLVLRTAAPENIEEVARVWDPQGLIPLEKAQSQIAKMAENHGKNRPGRIVHLCLAVAERERPQTFVGWCGLDGASGDQLQLFYSIVPERQGRGYATQAARAVLEYAFQKAGVPFVNGGCHKENLASYRVMEKIGMRPVGLGEDGNPLFFLSQEEALACFAGEPMIGRSTLADCPAIYRLICGLEGEEFPYRQFEEVFRRQQESGGYICLVARWEGRVAGVLNLRIEGQLHHCGSVAEIMELAVDPACRGKGIGGALLAKAWAEAKQRECLVLEVASAGHRDRAHGFYLRHGLEQTHKKFSVPLAQKLKVK